MAVVFGQHIRTGPGTLLLPNRVPGCGIYAIVDDSNLVSAQAVGGAAQTGRLSPVWTLAEVGCVALAIDWVIWRGRTLPPYVGALIPCWMIASFLLRGDTARTVGMRADNLGPATRNAAIVFGCFALMLIATGLALHQPVPALHALSPGRFGAYLAFCLLQQVGLSSFFTNRLLSVVPRRWLAALLAGLIFSAFHWPNPVLVPATLIGGVATAWLFARHRNILPLALGQAAAGALVSWAFPAAWHHLMRVGPGYFRPY